MDIYRYDQNHGRIIKAQPSLRLINLIYFCIWSVTLISNNFHMIYNLHYWTFTLLTIKANDQTYLSERHGGQYTCRQQIFFEITQRRLVFTS